MVKQCSTSVSKISKSSKKSQPRTTSVDFIPISAPAPIMTSIYDVKASEMEHEVYSQYPAPLSPTYSSTTEIMEEGEVTYDPSNLYEVPSLFKRVNVAAADMTMFFPLQPEVFFSGTPFLTHVSGNRPCLEVCDTIVRINTRFTNPGDKSLRTTLLFPTESDAYARVKGLETAIVGQFLGRACTKDGGSIYEEFKHSACANASSFVSSINTQDVALDNYASLACKIVYAPDFKKTMLFSRDDATDLSSDVSSKPLDELVNVNGYHFATCAFQMSSVWIRQNSWGIVWEVNYLTLNALAPRELGLQDAWKSKGDYKPVGAAPQESKEAQAMRTFLDRC
jgi:hypothetical protein